MKLSEICDYINERVNVSDLTLDTYISTENMLPNKEGITRSAGLPTVSQTSSFDADDVLISNIRPYFRKIWFADRNGGCSNDVLVLRAKENCEPNYLYYLLSSNDFFDYASATAKGTKMPRGDKTAIMNYEVSLPPLPEQKRIAAVLSALDEKIAVNNKINHNLEQTARAVFEEYCLDGKVGKLSDIVEVCYGKDHKKLSDGNIPCYGSGGIMRYVNSFLYNGESVLIPRKGTLNNVIYINEEFWTVDTMFYTKMLVPNVAKFVYFTINSLDLAGMNVGSAVPSMTTAVLNELEIIIPTEKTLAKFELSLNRCFFKLKRTQKIQNCL